MMMMEVMVVMIRDEHIVKPNKSRRQSVMPKAEGIRRSGIKRSCGCRIRAPSPSPSPYPNN